MVDRFVGLLWGDLMVGLMLGSHQEPGAREIAQRAQAAATAFVQLFPLPP